MQGNSSVFTSVHWWVVVPREVCFSKHLNSLTTTMKTDCQAVGGGFSVIGGRLDTPIVEDLFLNQIRIEAPTFSFVLEPNSCGILGVCVCVVPTSEGRASVRTPSH